MSKIFSNTNPSQIYMDSLIELLFEGEECSPRGKKIKEIRPVIIEYKNPLNRVTFLKGRVINPFFQLAEALWIATGRSDVQWLTQYNKNMSQFSDDGVYFNAPYGERLRFWNKSDANHFIFNPIDQLKDVYAKIKEDKDTRQAVAVIYNPLFDNALIETKDRPCNMIITFKVRNNKLDINVFNRSNDIHWGTFGANLCQFSTLQEIMANWLGVEVGTYYQTTDSFHVYLDDYGAKETEKIFKAYDLNAPVDIHEIPTIDQFTFDTEPRMSSDMKSFDNITSYYFKTIDQIIYNPSVYEEIDNNQAFKMILSALQQCPDDYWRMTFTAMAAYRAHKCQENKALYTLLDLMVDSSWKVSCLRFLSKKHKDDPQFRLLYNHLGDDIKNYIERKGE